MVLLRVMETGSKEKKKRPGGEEGFFFLLEAKDRTRFNQRVTVLCDLLHHRLVYMWISLYS